MTSPLERVRVAIDDPNELVSAMLLRIGYRPTDAVVVTTLREQDDSLLPGASVIISLARAQSGLTDLDHIPHGLKASVTLFVTDSTAQRNVVGSVLRWVMKHYDVVAWSAVVGSSLGNILVRRDGGWAWSGDTYPVNGLARSAVGNAAVVAGEPFRWEYRDIVMRWANPLSASRVALLKKQGGAATDQEVIGGPSAAVCSIAWQVLQRNADEVSEPLMRAFRCREFRDAVIASCFVGCEERVRQLDRARVEEVFTAVFTGSWAGRLHHDSHAVIESLRYSTYYVEGTARWNVLAALAFFAWACSDKAAAWALCDEIPSEVDMSLRDLLRQAMSVGLNIRRNDVA